jgi:hypothetical protein
MVDGCGSDSGRDGAHRAVEHLRAQVQQSHLELGGLQLGECGLRLSVKVWVEHRVVFHDETQFVAVSVCV